MHVSSRLFAVNYLALATAGKVYFSVSCICNSLRCL